MNLDYVAVLGGIASFLGGIAVLIKELSSFRNYFEQKLDALEATTSRNLLVVANKAKSLDHEIEANRSDTSHKFDLLEYQLSAVGQKLDHKSLRFENAINQIAAFLESSQNYRPKSIFPTSEK